MSSEVFRRVGRGGAGNWYSKKDVEDADKAAHENDIESEAHTTSQQSSVPGSSSSSHSHGGRGGAGNFVDSTTADQARRQELEDTERTKAAVVRQVAKPKAGLSGRGGAGNWSADVNALAAAEGEEKQKQAELEARIMQDVEAGLPPPPPAYHHSGRDQDQK